MLQATGRYYDGETAKQRTVLLTLTPVGLRIVDVKTGNAPIDVWPLDEMRRIETGSSGDPVRFSRGDTGKARLTVDEPDFAAMLVQLSSKGARHSGWRRWVASAGAIAATLLFLVFGVPYLSGWIAPLVPVTWETSLRDVSINSIQLAFGKGEFCDGEAGNDALEKLTARLTATVDSDYEIRVRVTSHDAVNAFAAIGGDIVIFIGLIEIAESSDEVAAVLAHELAHLMRRHPTQALVRALGFDLMLDLLTGGSFAGDVGQTALALSYSRDAEREADAVGAKMLGDAGIRRDGLSEFFRRVEEKEGARPAVLRYLSSHPPLEERVETAAKARGGGPAMSPQAFDALRRICK